MRELEKKISGQLYHKATFYVNYVSQVPVA